MVRMKGGEAIHFKEKHIQDMLAKQAGERSYFYVPSSAQKEPVLSTTKTFIKLKKLLDISFSIACYLIAKLKNFFDPQLITCPLIKNPRCFSGGPLIINPSTIYHHS